MKMAQFRVKIMKIDILAQKDHFSEVLLHLASRIIITYFRDILGDTSHRCDLQLEWLIGVGNADS